MKKIIPCVIATTLGLGGCATYFYEKTGTGVFSGRLDVEWIAPNQFIYRPHATDPLVYTTADGMKIQPREMFTDGGSIPRLFWSTPLLGPWDFAPGYIIHDWIFEQHHCKEGDWQKIDFPRSAQILAEAIKTQMAKAGDSEPTVVWAVYQAVRSPVAEKLWNGGTCKKPPREVPLPMTPEGRRVEPVRIMTISFPRR